MKLELESTATIMQSPFAAGDLSGDGFDAAKISEMLKAGIAAAKEGNRAEARALLLRVAESQSDNETAWLWLASISEYPEELLVFLNNVLDINPNNERALEWSRATKSLLAKTFVQRGITASRESQKDLANQCFRQALAHDGANEMAWLWLASIADSTEEKMAHLERVLSLNPENETAQASLKSVKHQMSQALLKKANVAAISGEHEAAREMLDELMNLSPEMEEAWILKAYLSESHDEKIACFEKVLAFNPENETAQAGIASLHAIRQRELERQAQKAEFERLAAVAQAELLESAKPVSEEVPELFFDLNSAEQNQPSAEEYPDFNFTEEEEDIHKTSTAEENQIESSFSQDSPTQELEPEFVENLEIQSAFASQSQPVVEENLQEDEEVFAEEKLSNDVSETDSAFSAATETDTNKFAQETEMEKDPQAEMSTQFQPQENYAYESKDFEIMTEPDSYFEETYSQPGENSAAVDTEKSSEPPSFADSEGFVQKLAGEYAEPDADEDYLIDDTFAPNNWNQVGDYLPKNGFPQYHEESVENSEVLSSAEFGAPKNEAADDETDAAVYEIQVEENETVETYFQTADAAEENNFDEDENLFEENAVAEASFEEPQQPQEEAPVSAQKTLSPAVSFDCPFCAAVNEPQSFMCPSCKAVLTLSDLEMLLSHQEADRSLLLEAVEKMESEMSERQFNAEELMFFGIAHLNLKNMRQGFSYLQQASQMNQNNVVLGGQVNALAIRLDEIERQESKTQEAKSRTILVVDDSPTVRKLISGKLEKSGHTVVLAVDGMDALAKISEVVPDLILLDITMPRMDGYQVCKLIRNNNLTKEIPVVMISGKDGFFDKVRGRMAGSTGYITKPFGPDTLMRTIDAYLN